MKCVLIFDDDGDNLTWRAVERAFGDGEVATVWLSCIPNKPISSTKKGIYLDGSCKYEHYPKVHVLQVNFKPIEKTQLIRIFFFKQISNVCATCISLRIKIFYNPVLASAKICFALHKLAP